MSKAIRHVPALDGLRGVAILAVMLYHYVTLGFGGDTTIGRHLISAADGLWTGVDLFFALSGYLITGILLRAKGSTGYFRNFYARRILRIFPLYYGSLVVLFLILPHFLPAQAPGVRRIVDSQSWLWTYSENIVIATQQSNYFEAGWLWIPHFWSLAVEEHFYLLWPLLVFLCSTRALVAVSIAFVVGAPVLRLVLLAHHVSSTAVYVLAPCRIDELAFGGLAAIAVQTVSLDRLARWARWGIAVSAAYLVGAVVVRRRPLDWWSWSACGLGFTALGLGAACAVALAASGRAGALGSVLESRWLRLLGKYSYGAYVVHQPLEPLYLRLLPPERIAKAAGSLGHVLSTVVGLFGYTLFAIVSTMLVAAASFAFYEHPFLQLKKYFEYRVPPRSEPLPAAQA